MLDDFIVRAFLAGVGVALVAGPLGCLLIWRGMAFYGDTLAHSALLGVTLALIFDINLMLGVFVVGLVISLLLAQMQASGLLKADTLLGLFSHAALAISLVVISLISWLRFDLLGLLFGDILAVSRLDLVTIYGGGLVVLCLTALCWRTLLADTISPEIAAAEGLPRGPARFAFMLILALFIAVAMKIVGVILITALLIIPAATARYFARSPEQMAIVASGLGVLAIFGGLYGSLKFDTTTGPSIILAAFGLFLLVILLKSLWRGKG